MRREVEEEEEEEEEDEEEVVMGKPGEALDRIGEVMDKEDKVGGIV